MPAEVNAGNKDENEEEGADGGPGMNDGA
jgi:hypothetical protein